MSVPLFHSLRGRCVCEHWALYALCKYREVFILYGVLRTFSIHCGFSSSFCRNTIDFSYLCTFNLVNVIRHIHGTSLGQTLSRKYNIYIYIQLFSVLNFLYPYFTYTRPLFPFFLFQFTLRRSWYKIVVFIKMVISLYKSAVLTWIYFTISSRSY